MLQVKSFFSYCTTEELCIVIIVWSVSSVDWRDQFAKVGYVISVPARLSDTCLKHQSLEKHVHWVLLLVRCKVLLTKWRCQIWWSYWQGWRCQIWWIRVTDKVKMSNLIELLTQWRCQTWWSYWQGEDVKFDGEQKKRHTVQKISHHVTIKMLVCWETSISFYYYF